MIWKISHRWEIKGHSRQEVGDNYHFGVDDGNIM